MLYLEPKTDPKMKLHKYSVLLKDEYWGPYTDKRELQICIKYVPLSMLERFLNSDIDVYIKEMIRVQKMKYICQLFKSKCLRWKGIFT